MESYIKDIARRCDATTANIAIDCGRSIAIVVCRNNNRNSNKGAHNNHGNSCNASTTRPSTTSEYTALKMLDLRCPAQLKLGKKLV